MKINLNGHEWTVLLTDRKNLNGDDGQCHTRTLIIYISNDLKGDARLCSFVHELTHAILNSSGRYYQSKFQLEEVCEFVAWNRSIIEKYAIQFIEEIGLDEK